MKDFRLQMVNPGIPENESQKKLSQKQTKRVVAKATFDRLWLLDEKQFDPTRNAIERIRLKRTLDLIDQILTKNNEKIADLATGTAYFIQAMKHEKRIIHAVDIATTPLKKLESLKLPHVTTYQDLVPYTTLESDDYDLVLGLELIGDLQKEEYRLFFSELSRLVKSEGYVIGSTNIDIDSEDALQNFASLAESEFHIDRWVLSYHSYMIRLLRFFKAPKTFVKASKDKKFFDEELSQRFSINAYLFKLNCSEPLLTFWKLIQYFTNPLLNYFEQNEYLTLKLEKLCRFFSSETGISHAIFVGQRRKLFEEIKDEEMPIERKGKREVWE